MHIISFTESQDLSVGVELDALEIVSLMPWFRIYTFLWHENSRFRFTRVTVACEYRSEEIRYKHINLFHVVQISGTKIANILALFDTGGQEPGSRRQQTKQYPNPEGLLEYDDPSRRKNAGRLQPLG
jgi:hypothetical protein